MHTHQPPAGCSLLGRTRPCRRPSGSFRPCAGTRYMHTRHRQSARLQHVQITRTRARCACTTAAHTPALSAAGMAASHPSAARSMAASRDARRRCQGSGPISPSLRTREAKQSAAYGCRCAASTRGSQSACCRTPTKGTRTAGSARRGQQRLGCNEERGEEDCGSRSKECEGGG